jgi:hypothetical protein
MKHDLEQPSEEFLREGLEHVIPALRALKIFHRSGGGPASAGTGFVGSKT